MKHGYAVVAAIASGALLAASMPSLELWPLAWVAPAPLLLGIRGRRGRDALVIGWIGGTSFYLALLYWIVSTITTYTAIPTVVATLILLLMAATAGLFIGVFALLVEWLAQAGISRVVAVPVCWVVIEWLRTFFPLAFPWGLLGYSQYSASVVVQLADLAGVYGLSALLMFTGAALAELLSDGLARHRALAVATAVVVVSALAYGTLRLGQIEGRTAEASLRVGVVQGNIAQAEKWLPQNQGKTLARYLALSIEAAKDGARLIVWPEAAVPFLLADDTRGKRLSDFARLSGTQLLVGAPGRRRQPDASFKQYNEAWLITPEQGLARSYAKMRLVPFGEYVPWGGLFGLVDRLVEGVADFGRGSEYVVFAGPEVAKSAGPERVRLASLVCYEGIFPGLTRRFVASGAEVLFNLSNDAWYGRSSAPEQLLAMVAMRAVENRVPVIRATNTGVSAIIDASGRIRRRTDLFEEAVFVDDVAITAGRSLYAVIGDTFVYMCIAVLALLISLRLSSGAVLIRESGRGILPG